MEDQVEYNKAVLESRKSYPYNYGYLLSAAERVISVAQDNLSTRADLLYEIESMRNAIETTQKNLRK